jgi:Regulator of ribonuclease activity B
MMNSVFFWLALFLGPSAVWFLLRQLSKRRAAATTVVGAADLDAQVLAELAEAGSDLSKEQRLEFFLVLPTESAAREAAAQIESMGFKAEAIAASPQASWVCIATKSMLPQLQTLESLSGQFRAIATSLGGEYDGWGSPVGESAD